jgi:3-oxoacid CoA-transferase subunit A
MNKIVESLAEAVKDIKDGARLMVGGFAACGGPNNLVQALIAQGTKDLTIICTGSPEWLPFVSNDRVKKVISGFTSHSLRPEITEVIESKVVAGKLEVETVPHGILSERIRARKAGIPGFYTPIGVGTVFGQGKEIKVFGGKECVLETALEADFALIAGYRGDRLGNIACRYVARNRNVEMAGAATVTIAEVEHIVKAGDLDPERVDIPGIFVQRVVQAPKVVKWLDGHEAI